MTKPDFSQKICYFFFFGGGKWAKNQNMVTNLKNVCSHCIWRKKIILNLLSKILCTLYRKLHIWKKSGSRVRGPRRPEFRKLGTQIASELFFWLCSPCIPSLKNFQPTVLFLKPKKCRVWAYFLHIGSKIVKDFWDIGFFFGVMGFFYGIFGYYLQIFGFFSGVLRVIWGFLLGYVLSKILLTSARFYTISFYFSTYFYNPMYCTVFFCR